MLSTGLTFAIQMIATVALARLLKPADFGVMTMVTTFSILLVSVGQIGFPEAVLQRDEVDHYLVSNLFWVNVGIALLLTVGFAASGSLLAKFYGDPRVAHVAIAASLTIFITSTSVLHLALLKRAMRFAAVSVNDIVARTVAVVVTIFLGWAGWGYWALVAGAIALPISTSIGAWILCRWIPSLPRRVAGTGSMVRFAASVCGRWSVGYCTQNTDNLLVGWQFGSGALGFYKKAYDLFLLSFSCLNIYPVVVSTLSRLKSDHVQYRRYFLGGLAMLALVGMAIGADLTLVGRDVVRLVLGPGWEKSGQIFTLFGPGIGLMLIYSTQGMIHLSIGTTGRYFRWGMIEFTVTVLLFLLALPWGPAGVAAAWTASFWILTVPALWYAGRPIQLGLASVIGAIWKFLLASLMAGCACAFITQEIPTLAARSDSVGALIRIIADSILFGVLYIVIVILLHGGAAPLRQFAGLLREMVSPGRFVAATHAVDATYFRDASAALTPTATERGV